MDKIFDWLAKNILIFSDIFLFLKKPKRYLTKTSNEPIINNIIRILLYFTLSNVIGILITAIKITKILDINPIIYFAFSLLQFLLAFILIIPCFIFLKIRHIRKPFRISINLITIILFYAYFFINIFYALHILFEAFIFYILSILIVLLITISISLSFIFIFRFKKIINNILAFILLIVINYGFNFSFVFALHFSGASLKDLIIISPLLDVIAYEQSKNVSEINADFTNLDYLYDLYESKYIWTKLAKQSLIEHQSKLNLFIQKVNDFSDKSIFNNTKAILKNYLVSTENIKKYFDLISEGLSDCNETMIIESSAFMSKYNDALKLLSDPKTTLGIKSYIALLNELIERHKYMPFYITDI